VRRTTEMTPLSIKSRNTFPGPTEESAKKSGVRSYLSDYTV
jgi:hypothetical protein